MKGHAPPVFFYFRNEDNVELYVEHTGLMWESAPVMGAALVFLEHLYYGLSLPFPAGTPGCVNYLTTEQAMADAASFLTSMRGGMLPQLPEVGAVIGFGGSYGGMMTDVVSSAVQTSCGWCHLCQCVHLVVCKHDA